MQADLLCSLPNILERNILVWEALRGDVQEFGSENAIRAEADPALPICGRDTDGIFPGDSEIRKREVS
jgi:hypothetical protein